MAKEYKCARCGKPAVVHITRITGKGKLILHFCEDCAKKFALDNPNIPSNLDPEIRKFEEAMFNKKSKDSCSNCGALLIDLKNGDKPSCPDCYSILDDSVIDMLSQMHSATKHIGKTPRCHSDNVDTSAIFQKRDEVFSDDFISELEDVVSSAIESVAGIQLNVEKKSQKDKEVKSTVAKEETAEEKIKKLQKALDEAVSQERYEDAAKLRDQINALAK